MRPPRPHPLPGASAARGREWAAPGSALGGPGQTGPTGAPRPPSGRRPGPFHACLLAAGPAAPCGKSYGASGRPQRLCPLECRPCRPCEVCGKTGGQEGEVRRLGPRHGLLYRPPFSRPPWDSCQMRGGWRDLGLFKGLSLPGPRPSGLGPDSGCGAASPVLPVGPLPCWASPPTGAPPRRQGPPSALFAAHTCRLPRRAREAERPLVGNKSGGCARGVPGPPAQSDGFGAEVPHGPSVFLWGLRLARRPGDRHAPYRAFIPRVPVKCGASNFGRPARTAHLGPWVA